MTPDRAERVCGRVVRSTGVASAATLVILLALLGCHRPRRYETQVEVARMTPVRKDESGKILTLDLELRYPMCPGTQVEVIRSDAAFAACVSKYKVGENVPASIDHARIDDGRFRWTVTKVGECVCVPDPDDEASYALVRECEDSIVNGQRVGFQCNYTPERALIAKCPWFRQR